MATTTTNLGLTKPAGSEHLSLVTINGNYDIIDAFAGLVKGSLLNIPTYGYDCDDIDHTCTVYVTGDATNSPGAWSLMTTIVYDASDAVVQYAFSVPDRTMKMRSKSGSPATWSAWKPILMGGSVQATVPNGTTAGSYKIGTFSSLGIPTGATIISAQCSNVTSSVCHVSGFSVSGSDIYVYVVETVTVADGQVRVTYTL